MSAHCILVSSPDCLAGGFDDSVHLILGSGLGGSVGMWVGWSDFSQFYMGWATLGSRTSFGVAGHRVGVADGPIALRSRSL